MRGLYSEVERVIRRRPRIRSVWVSLGLFVLEMMLAGVVGYNLALVRMNERILSAGKKIGECQDQVDELLDRKRPRRSVPRDGGERTV